MNDQLQRQERKQEQQQQYGEESCFSSTESLLIFSRIEVLRDITVMARLFSLKACSKSVDGDEPVILVAEKSILKAVELLRGPPPQEEEHKEEKERAIERAIEELNWFVNAMWLIDAKRKQKEKVYEEGNEEQREKGLDEEKRGDLFVEFAIDALLIVASVERLLQKADSLARCAQTLGRVAAMCNERPDRKRAESLYRLSSMFYDAVGNTNRAKIQRLKASIASIYD